MGWLITIGKQAIKGFQKAKSMIQRQGAKSQAKSASKAKPAQAAKAEEKAAETKDKVHDQAQKATEELKQKGMVTEPEDATGKETVPGDTPANTNNGGGDGPHRGRSLLHDSHYQSPQTSHDQGMEV